MPVRSPAPDELEPIERASRDELGALQLERLKWSVRRFTQWNFRAPATTAAPKRQRAMR